MAEATLNDVSKRLKNLKESNTQGFDGLENEFVGLRRDFFQLFQSMKKSLLAIAMDNLEANREAKKSNNKVKAGGTGSKIDTPPLIGIQGLLAGIGAIGAAIGGLRGWELKALSNLSKIGKALRLLFPVTLAARIAAAIIPKGFKSFPEFITSKFSN